MRPLRDRASTIYMPFGAAPVTRRPVVRYRRSVRDGGGRVPPWTRRFATS